MNAPRQRTGRPLAARKTGPGKIGRKAGSAAKILTRIQDEVNALLLVVSAYSLYSETRADETGSWHTRC